MVKLDLKDRKILYQLDLNCRQSNTQIGKKVGLKKDVVSYRINRMEKEKIIKGYWTEIDSYRFGFQVYRYYLILQNATPTIKNEIVQEIGNYKNTWTVATIQGNYDISAVIWVKDPSHFYQFWDTLNEHYGDYFADKLFSIYLQSDIYPLSYLIQDEEYTKDRENPEYVGYVRGNKLSDISYQDYQILDLLAENARMPIVDVAEHLNSSSQTVNYHLKKMQEIGIIQGFHIVLDVSKIGYKNFKVDIWLKQISKRKKLWEKFKFNPYVTFINTSAGYADLEIEFTIENSDKLIEEIEKVIEQFPGAIRKYIFWSAHKEGKLRCLPKLRKADFAKV